MDKLSYRQARDKIIEAYFKDEIEPFNANFCFCGTLAPPEYEQGYKNWNNHKSKKRSKAHSYSYDEYLEMETALLVPLKARGVSDFALAAFHLTQNNPEWEEKLFEGMSNALDVLKEIHRSRGENVDEDIPAFTKRELINSVVSAR